VAINLTEDQQRKNDAARQQLQANRDAQAQNRDAQVRMVGDEGEVKPTPTQEENDMAKLGAYIPEHEPDGSPEQSGVGFPSDKMPGGAPQSGTQTRAMEPGQRGRFQTRNAGQPQPPNPNPNP
jgi:type II secretory pathway pseudopilin PulG